MLRFRDQGRGGLALIACLALAFAPRFFDLDRATVWGDEVVTFKAAATDGPPQLLDYLMGHDATRAPLHPLILQGWFRTFGKSLYAGRFLSALFGMACVWLVYRLGLLAFDRRTALLACLLAAVNPLDIHHSREIRMYEALVLATCSAWTVLMSFRDGAGPIKRVTYLLALAAMCYLHPLGGLMVIALGLGYWILRPGLRLGWPGFVGIHVALAAILSPWVIHYFDHPPQVFSKQLTAEVLFEWPEAFTGGSAEAAWIGLILLILGIVAASRAGGEKMTVLGRGIDRHSAALLAWFVIPPLLLFAYTVTRHPIFGQRRYVLYVGPAYLLLLARGIMALPIRARFAATFLFLMFSVSALDLRVFNLDRPDFRSACRLVAANAPTAPVVVVGYKGEKLYRCMEFHREPAQTGRVMPFADMVRDLTRPGAIPLEEAWIAIERPKDRPRRPMPKEIAMLYVADRSFELPHLTLAHVRRIRLASAGRTSPPVGIGQPGMNP